MILQKNLHRWEKFGTEATTLGYSVAGAQQIYIFKKYLLVTSNISGAVRAVYTQWNDDVISIDSMPCIDLVCVFNIKCETYIQTKHSQ